VRRTLPLTVLLCLGLALGVAGPLAFDPANRIAGDWRHPDCLGNHWLLVWVAEQVRSGGSLLHNDLYYWPFGDAPWLAGNGSDGFLYLPFHSLWGWPTAAGLYVTALLLCNGLAGYALGVASGAGRHASWVVAAATVCSLYAVLELSAGRFSQGNLTWLLLSLAALVRLLHAPGRGRAVASGALAAACAFFYLYYGFFLLLAGAAMLAIHRARGQALPWKHLALAAGTGGALIAPLVWVMAHHWTTIPGSEEAYPVAMLTMDSIRPSLGILPRGTPVQVSSGQALPILLLVLVWVVQRLRTRTSPTPTEWSMVGIALLGGWLALGPPAGLFTWIYGAAPPLERFWWPYRHVVLLGIGLSVLAARGLREVGGDRLLPALAATLLVPASLLLQGLPVVLKSSPLESSPPVYAELAGHDASVLLSVPFLPGTTGSQAPLAYQLFHGKTMLGGHAPWVDRVRPAAWDRWIQENSFLSALSRLESGRGPHTLTFQAADLQTLISKGLGLVVLDRSLIPVELRGLAETYTHVFGDLFGAPLHREQGVLVFDTGRWTGAVSVEEAGFLWPSLLERPGPNQVLGGRRPRNPVFQPRGEKP
jgi:hypothetical protein